MNFSDARSRNGTGSVRISHHFLLAPSQLGRKSFNFRYVIINILCGVLIKSDRIYLFLSCLTHTNFKLFSTFQLKRNK